MNIADIERLEAHLNADPAADQRALTAIRELLDGTDEVEQLLRKLEIGDLEDLEVELLEARKLKGKVRELFAMKCMAEGCEVTEEAADLMREIDEEFL